MNPTIVLVHGAFAESASWSRVIEPLSEAGHHVIAAANPLRGVASDAAALSDLLATVEGPVVLVGHSYGGMVISNVAADAADIVGLVYVAAFAPEPGEDCIALSERFPGSTLGEALQPIARADGSTDLAIAQDRFHEQFAADLPAELARTLACTQRPIAQAALAEGSGAPLWRKVPSWFLYGSEDRNIPAELQRFMAERAGARRSIRVEGASHAIAASNPESTVELITAAAHAPVAA